MIFKDLKTDPKLPHHYIIGVCMSTLNDKVPGKLYLKYNPVYFNNKDIETLRNIIAISTDEVLVTSEKDALNMYPDIKHLVSTITGMKFSCHANHATMHHFSSEFLISDELFESFVKSANINENTRRKLYESKISIG